MQARKDFYHNAGIACSSSVWCKCATGKMLLALILEQQIPDVKTILLAMILGFFSYGLSIVLFVVAMRDLGSAITKYILFIKRRS